MVMKTVLNVKMDSDIKRKFQETAQEVGLPLSLIIGNYAQQFIQDKQITFRAPEIPNKKTAKILDEIERDSKLGRNFVGPFKTGKEAADYLRSL